MDRRAKKGIGYLCALCILAICGLFCSFGAASAQIAGELLDEENWNQLAGFTYTSPGVSAPAGTRYPADVTFPADDTDVGIRYRGKGYYQADTTDFSGIVYRTPFDVLSDGFSITFTVNKLGVNSSAGDVDGWLGIGLMERDNLWHTSDRTVNQGAVLLMRPSSREMSCYIHELGENISTFRGGSIPTVLFGATPAVTGATFRYSIEKRVSVGTAYYAKMEQLNPADGSVVSSKNFSTPLPNVGEVLFENGNYLAISASSGDIRSEWDFSIKAIDGVVVGKKPDGSGLTADEAADEILSYVDSLKIYDYLDPVSEAGVIRGAELNERYKSEAPAFYTHENKELNIDDFSTKLSVLLAGMDDETQEALYLKARVDTMFETPEAYRTYLQACIACVTNYYEKTFSDDQLETLETALGRLPGASEISAESELDALSLFREAQYAFQSLNLTSLGRLTEAEKEAVRTKLDGVFSSLSSVGFERYIAGAAKIPDPLTMENAGEAVFLLAGNEVRYDTYLEYLGDVSELEETLRVRTAAAKSAFDELGSGIAALKAVSSENNAKILEYEEEARVMSAIVYLPVASVENLETLFGLVADCNLLSAEARGRIPAEDAARLAGAASGALGAAILQLPALSQMSSYDVCVQNGYDMQIDKLGRYRSALTQFDAAAGAGLESARLDACRRKLALLKSPLSAKNFVPATEPRRAGETFSVYVVDLFKNDNALALSFVCNYGSVDVSTGEFTFTPDAAGTYEITITAADAESGQNATATFTLVIDGAEKSGCGTAGAAGGGGLLLTLALASLAFLGLCNGRVRQ